MKKFVRIMIAAAIILIAGYMIASGFRVRTDVAVVGYALSEDGTEMTIQTNVMSSAGHTRTCKDEYDGQAHCLKFYSAFGGLNGSIGAESEFTLSLSDNDTEIAIFRGDQGYFTVLEKDSTDNEWKLKEK